MSNGASMAAAITIPYCERTPEDNRPKLRSTGKVPAMSTGRTPSAIQRTQRSPVRQAAHSIAYTSTMVSAPAAVTACRLVVVGRTTSQAVRTMNTPARLKASRSSLRPMRRGCTTCRTNSRPETAVSGSNTNSARLFQRGQVGHRNWPPTPSDAASARPSTVT
ncbi:hypothetical protein D9M69_554310 [compost metagenome]